MGVHDRRAGSAPSTRVENARESWLRAILGNLPDVVLVLDAEGYYREVLSRSAHLIAPPEQLLGRSIHEVLPSGAAADVQAVIDRTLRTGDTQEHEYSLPVDGRERYFQARVVSFPCDGEDAVLWVARDISDRKREEVARRELETRMQEAQRLESLGILAGGIAHDFNNLLVGVLANTSLVLEALPPASEYLPMLRDVEQSALRAAGLCQQMLAYAGRGGADFERVDLNEIIPEVRHLVGATTSKLAEIEFDLAVSPPIVDADVVQLRQVLMNLVTNASEALGDGAGSIRITTGRREFDAESLASARPEPLSAGTYVFLQVTDNGCGMDLETSKRLFEPFFSTKFAGRGLGMASVLGIVRRHAGALQVESRPGEGATIRVLFPAAADVPRASSTEESAAAATRRTILCIDDEDIVRSVVSRVLDRAGFEVLTSGDPLTGLELYAARVADVDALIVDATMPRMQGREVVARVRAISPDLPILVISGHDGVELQEQFEGYRVATLHKPFASAALNAAVTELLGRGAGPVDGDLGPRA